jgi:hypothetical protein
MGGCRDTGNYRFQGLKPLAKKLGVAGKRTGNGRIGVPDIGERRKAKKPFEDLLQKATNSSEEHLVSY